MSCHVMYVFMYVCKSCMYVCTYVCMYACVHVCVCMYVCMYVCMHVCMYVCMYMCMYVCMHVCMYMCMYVCITYHLLWNELCAKIMTISHSTNIPPTPGRFDDALPRLQKVRAWQYRIETISPDMMHDERVRILDPDWL